MKASEGSHTREPEDGAVNFGPFELTQTGWLRLSSRSGVQLPRRLARLMCALLKASGAAVSRHELIERCWGDELAGDENLSRAIADLRKILRRGGLDKIETIYGLGYRLSLANDGDEADTAKMRSAAFCREAWHRVYERQIASLDAAEALFERAVSEYSANLEANLGIAEVQIHRMQIGYARAIEAWPRARPAIDRALRIDESCASALGYLGLGQTWAEWDFAGAEMNLERARSLDPNGYVSNQASGLHMLSRGMFDSAQEHFGKAIAANPAAMPAYAALAITLAYRGEASKALSTARKMLRIDPFGAVSLGFAALIEARHGIPERAVAEAERCFSTLKDSPVAGSILALALACAGQKTRARELLESQAGSSGIVGLNPMACPAWLELGDTQRGLASLEAGAANHCPWLMVILHDASMAALQKKPLVAALRSELFGQNTSRDR